MDGYSNATGAIVVAWRAQGWFVNMFEVEAHDKAAHAFTWSKGGFQGGRGWQLNSTATSTSFLGTLCRAIFQLSTRLCAPHDVPYLVT